ncbi:transposase [Streptomyces sp. enrichment culture]|uniref:transposase n=1 Tax=Streptomyces sp. enrichment culture TaxID=1795815 RepID=UPI003F56A0C7
MPSSRATAVTVLPEESTSAIASRLNSSVYRFVYLLPTWCYFLWNLTSQSPGVHDQGEASPLPDAPSDSHAPNNVTTPLQATNRTDQQDPRWKRLYATRSSIEGTICELVNAHRAHRSRYHGHRKTHIQHVLTGIAINIERLASRPPQPLPRPPKDPHPTRSDRHRHQHRTPRLTSTSPPQRSHGVPALPRLARPDLGMLVATRQMSSILKIPDRVAQDMRTGAYSARPSGSGSRSGPRDARRLAARQLVARRGELQDLQVVGVLM